MFFFACSPMCSSWATNGRFFKGWNSIPIPYYMTGLCLSRLQFHHFRGCEFDSSNSFSLSLRCSLLNVLFVLKRDKQKFFGIYSPYLWRDLVKSTKNHCFPMWYFASPLRYISINFLIGWPILTMWYKTRSGWDFMTRIWESQKFCALSLAIFDGESPQSSCKWPTFCASNRC